jgi:hypothetical protein
MLEGMEIMAASATDLYALLEGLPSGAWAAISLDQHKVVAFGTNSEAVLAEALEKGEEHPLMLRKPEFNIPMCFPAGTRDRPAGLPLE